MIDSAGRWYFICLNKISMVGERENLRDREEERTVRIAEAELRNRITRWAGLYFAVVGSLLTITAYLGFDAYATLKIEGLVEKHVRAPMRVAEESVNKLVDQLIEQRVAAQSAMSQAKADIGQARDDLERFKRGLAASMIDVQKARSALQGNIKTAEVRLKHTQENTEAAFEFFYEKSAEKTTRQLLLANDVALTQSGISMFKELLESAEGGVLGQSQAEEFAKNWAVLTTGHKQDGDLIRARSKFKIIYYTRQGIGKAREKRIVELLTAKGYAIETWYFEEPTTIEKVSSEMFEEIEAPPQYILGGHIIVFANSGSKFVKPDIEEAVADVKGNVPLFRWSVMNPKAKIIGPGGYDKDKIIVMLDLSFTRS